MVRLEHVNVTVSDAKATAQTLCQLFDWKIRWEGASIYDGFSIHVGEENSYVALYSPGKTPTEPTNSYVLKSGLNHIAVVVDDLDLIEDRVVAQGYTPNSHADYEPGKRFYFTIEDGLEIEVVCYE